MKSRTVSRIVKRYSELSEAVSFLDGDRLKRVQNLPLLHLVKLADALDAEVVGHPTHTLWPSNIVDLALMSSGSDNRTRTRFVIFGSTCCGLFELCPT
jgi:hypothetical protein